MTGQEKIAAFIQEINKAHQELITGNKVRLYSGGLPGTLEEQKQILDILANEKQAIKYSQSDVYQSEDDIDPEMRIHILEESVGDGLAERYMIEQLMESQWYDIEILDGFTEVIAEQESQDQQDIGVDPQESEPIDFIHLKLEPDDYDKKSGSLRLAPHIIVEISKRGNAKTLEGSMYLECRVMERVFKTVNTLRSGVSFSKILTKHDTKIGTTEKRSVRNAVDAINKKITDGRGPERLLKIQNGKVFVNNSYL